VAAAAEELVPEDFEERVVVVVVVGLGIKKKVR
jgi:hypothetical protein